MTQPSESGKTQLEELTKLTLPVLIRSLSIAQLWGLLSTIVSTLVAVTTIGFLIGKWTGNFDLSYLNRQIDDEHSKIAVLTDENAALSHELAVEPAKVAALTDQNAALSHQLADERAKTTTVANQNAALSRQL